MPELPEVETVRTGLEKALKGATIENVTLRRKGLRVDFPADLAKKLKNRTIKSIARRAKYLVFYFDGDEAMIAHLGMSGRFLLTLSAPKSFGKHDHAVFVLGDGRCVIFNDPRRFGLLTLSRVKELPKHPLLAAIGPDPFDEAFSPGYLKGALKSRTTAVKAALMDQALVAGVGNIYASEALFTAGIDPRARACDVAGRAGELVKAIRKVLKAAIASGGSSLRDFLHVSGDAGSFQHRFNVYHREGKSCLTCGTKIASIRQNGRATFFCPRCQK